MNIAIITEGRGDKYIYKSWIPFVNPNITYVDRIRDISSNNFSIVSGFGYPSYFQKIDEVIQDVNDHGHIDRLVIGIDSEELTLHQKQQEISDYLSSSTCLAPIFIIVHHFCIETWALGNRRFCPANPNHQPLLTYKIFFDVRSSDPELLPEYPPLRLNRAKFAQRYLSAICQSRNPHLTYNKSRPKPLIHNAYYQQVLLRHQTSGHIASFSFFLNAFI